MSRCGLLLLLLLPMLRAPARAAAENDAPPPRRTLVFVVHGDASYLYHDADGRAHEADEEVVRKAQALARYDARAEVFIFHRQPEQRLLGLFSRADGRWLHYAGGQLVEEASYDTEQGLEKEAALYRAHRTIPQDEAAAERLFFYYGHEVPAWGGAGYDASHPHRRFNVDLLAEGIRAFSPARPFDVAVLSTCNNGTPGTLQALAPRARYVVASPGNLHLSHLDPRLWAGAWDAEGGVKDAAQKFAEHAFEKLTRTTQTTVTVTLYDTRAVAPFLRANRAAVAAQKQAARRAGGQPGHTDCRQRAAFDLRGATGGVTAFYRPPRFGRRQDVAVHSGWGCWSVEAAPQASGLASSPQ